MNWPAGDNLFSPIAGRARVRVHRPKCGGPPAPLGRLSASLETPTWRLSSGANLGPLGPGTVCGQVGWKDARPIRANLGEHNWTPIGLLVPLEQQEQSPPQAAPSSVIPLALRWLFSFFFFSFFFSFLFSLYFYFPPAPAPAQANQLAWCKWWHLNSAQLVVSHQRRLKRHVRRHQTTRLIVPARKRAQS